MELLKGIGWFLVNVVVPLLGPIAMLPLLGLRERYRGRVKQILLRALQEGQLCWTVIAMCVAACYEASGELYSSPEDLNFNAAMRVFTITWHMLIIVCSATVVMFGAEDAEDKLIHGQSAAATTENQGAATTIMKASVVMAFVTSITFTLTHIWAD